MTWGELYALFCVETGWTWEYVDEEMTLPRCDGFVALWKQTPPLRTTLRIIAGALGMKDSESKSATPKPTDDEPVPAPARARSGRPDLGAYLDAFGSAGMQVEKRGAR